MVKVWFTVCGHMVESLIIGPAALRSALDLARKLSKEHFPDKVVNMTVEGGYVISFINGEQLPSEVVLKNEYQ